MTKENQLTFLKSEYIQYCYLLMDENINERIATFLLEYVSLEAMYKKMLVAWKEKDGKKLTKKERAGLKVIISDVNNVYAYFKIEYDEETVNRVFGSQDNNYMECSVKKLRDRLVHNVNENVLRIILERYDNIMNDIYSLKASMLGEYKV